MLADPGLVSILDHLLVDQQLAAADGPRGLDLDVPHRRRARIVFHLGHALERGVGRQEPLLITEGLQELVESAVGYLSRGPQLYEASVTFWHPDLNV